MRYFIIFFTLWTETTKGYGNCTWKDKNYPVHNEVLQFLIRDTPNTLEDYIITNIIELSKKDYESWNS